MQRNQDCSGRRPGLLQVYGYKLHVRVSLHLLLRNHPQLGSSSQLDAAQPAGNGADFRSDVPAQSLRYSSCGLLHSRDHRGALHLLLLLWTPPGEG